MAAEELTAPKSTSRISRARTLRIDMRAYTESAIATRSAGADERAGPTRSSLRDHHDSAKSVAPAFVKRESPTGI